MKRYNIKFEDGRSFTNITKQEMAKIILENENLRHHIEDVNGEYIPNEEDKQRAIRESRNQFFRDAYGS